MGQHRWPRLGWKTNHNRVALASIGALGLQGLRTSISLAGWSALSAAGVTLPLQYRQFWRFVVLRGSVEAAGLQIVGHWKSE